MEPEPLIRVLHLSDLALSVKGAWSQGPVLTGLARCVEDLRPDVVAVTGDVSSGGEEEEFKLAERWFTEELLPAAGLGVERLLLVPGERDVDRGALDEAASDVADGLRRRGQQAIAELLDRPERRGILLGRLKRWLAFANRLRGGRSRLDLPWWSEVVEVRGQKVEFAGLCSAWAATADPSDQGRLLVGAAQSESLLPVERAGALRVALLHHPPAWLFPDDGGRLERLLSQRADLLLRGHDPEAGKRRIERHARPLVEVIAGPATGQPKASFALIEVSPSEVRIRPFCEESRGWQRDGNRAGNQDGLIVLSRGAAPVASAPSQPVAPAPTWTLKAPPPLGPLPPDPYPILAPYTHPHTFGGRDGDLARLLALLGQERLVWTLYAQSGAGKSSLLRAGLLPALRGHTGLAPVPVALDHLPAVPGLARRLLHPLLVDPPVVADDDPLAFAAALARVRDLSGRRPVLVLDQLEEVFDTPALGWLGPLIAATEVAPGGRAARWVLAYRHEFHGRVSHWLGDVQRHGSLSPSLPRDLSGQDTAASWVLPLLGEVQRSPDPFNAAISAFEDAIRKPIDIKSYGRPASYDVRLSAADSRRLATAFAEVRLSAPDAPLTPELQVVLARLIEETPLQADGGCAPVLPPDHEALLARVDEAIGEHLLRKLREITRRAPPEQVPTRQTLALLLLGRLVNAAGRREAVPVGALLAHVGDEARALYQDLKASGVWLIREEQREDGLLWATLPHDRVAAEVRRMLDSADALARFNLDGESVGLWRLVDQRAAAWDEGRGDRGAVALEAGVFVALQERQAALPWEQRTREWWAAAVAARRVQDLRETLDRVRSTHPRSGEPLRALHRLRVVLDQDGAALAGALKVEPGRADALDAERREEIFGLGPAGLDEAERAEILPGLVEAMAPHVEGAGESESLYGALLAAVEVVRFYDREAAERARGAVVAAMRAARGEPPPLDPEDGSWSPVIAGRFQVGCFLEVDPQGQDDETLHEVVLSPYRMGRCAVSLGEYWRFASRHRAANRYPEDWPALMLSWYEAMAYAAWRGLMLPTEAQWEVAARGGSPTGYRKTAYYNGNGEDALSRVALYTGSQARIFKQLGSQRPLAVHDTSVFKGLFRGFQPHPLGLVHIHGNVAEWCRDWFASYPADGTSDPAGPPVPPDPAAARRVLRGGSWFNSALVARSACRVRYLPSVRYVTVGFRLVLPQPTSALDPGL